MEYATGLKRDFAAFPVRLWRLSAARGGDLTKAAARARCVGPTSNRLRPQTGTSATNEIEQEALPELQTARKKGNETMTIAHRSNTRPITSHFYRIIGAAAVLALSLGAGLALSPAGTKSAEAAGIARFILVETAVEQQEVQLGLDAQADESAIVLVAGTPEEAVAAFELISEAIVVPGPDGTLPGFFIDDQRPAED